MDKSTFFSAQVIREQINTLEGMGKGTLVWSVHIKDDKDTKLTDFSLDGPIQEAYEKARLKKIAELEKQFEEL